MSEFLASLDRLNLPDDVKAQLRALQPPAMPHADTIVARLSLVRTFTERTYQAATLDLDEAPSFATFTEAAEVEPLVGYPGRFAIAGRARSQRLSHWVTRSEERARLAAALAKALDPGDPVESLDWLQLLFLGDQAVARKALREAFDAADRANDIPQCAGLIQLVVSTVQLFGDDESAALCNELRARSQSRSLFFAEFYQTNDYFERPLDAALKEFVDASDDRWIFHLWAPGGMGKTTLLRRLISHDWVVGDRHIPCAWLDMDYLEVATILQHPALLGLVMAAQWNEQLAQPVFGTFLTPTLQPLASLLFRRHSDGSGGGASTGMVEQRARHQYRAGRSNPMRCGILAGAVPPRSLEEREVRLAQSGFLLSYWNDKLPEAIASMPSDRPVLLLLDTLEDASLQHGQQLLDFLKLVRTLRQRTRQIATAQGRPPVNLRLVLSGRYRLGGEHVLAFRNDFKDEYHEAALAGLEPREARIFLDAGIDDSRTGPTRVELIDAMVEKSHGIPFSLTLFVGWANDDPSLDADTVRRSDDVSAVMLIERTVKRIGYQPLRWVIRYGVVPRCLSIDFLRDVMRQPLEDALSGRAYDTGSDTPTSRVEQDVWARDEGFAFDADALWHDHVLPYASARNWVGVGERPEEVVFRSDILQPMRRLLREQAIFRQLHERARDWFKARRRDPKTGLNACIDYLYHCLQLRSIGNQPGHDLLPLVREFLEAPALAANPRLRVTACAALLNADFADLTSREQAYVEYVNAEALAAQHGYSYRAPEAVQALARAAETAGPDGLGALSPFAAIWMRAVDSVATKGVDRRHGTTTSELLAERAQAPPEDRLRVALLLAELSDGQSKVAQSVLAEAVAEAAAMEAPSVPVGVLAERLARRLRADDPEAALHNLVLAANHFGARGDQKKQSELTQLAASLELELGRVMRAQVRLESADAGPNRSPAVLRARAAVELAKGSPGVALQLLNSTESERDVAALLLRAEALSRQMRLGEARDAWELVSRAATSEADAGTASQIAIGQARMYRWWLRTTPKGTPPLVQSLLSRAQAAQSDVSQRVVATQVPDVEVWQIAFGQGDAASWQRRARGDYRLASPMARVRLTLALSQVIPDVHVRRWHDLVEDAARLPASARMLALAEPVLRGQAAEIEPAVRRAMADVFQHEPEGEVEAAWYAIRRGEWLGWLGYLDEAAELLARHVPVLSADYVGPGWSVAAYRERRRVEQRLVGWAGDNRASFPRPEPDPPELWHRIWGHTPFRGAAATIENAQRAFDVGHHDLMRECLEIARPGLQTVEIETEFHVTANRLLEVSSGGARPQTRGHAQADGVDAAAAPVGPTDGRLGGPPFDLIELREQAGRLVVAFERPAREVVLSAEHQTLEILLRSRGIPRRLLGMRLEQLADELGDVLQQAAIRDEGRRVGLKISHATVASAPWELAFAQQYPGLPAPFRVPSAWQEEQVADEARASEEGLGLKEAAASGPVLFQPMSPQDHESPAARAYALLASLFARRMEESGGVTGTAWSVYVASSFVELPQRHEPALAGGSWTASTLAHAVSRFAGPFRPTIVLDAPIPATYSDLVHQLLLRNAFAQSLADTGVVGCVLATGLRPHEAMLTMHRAVAEALRPEVPRMQLLDIVTARARDLNLAPHDALFSASPYQPIATGRPMYV